MLPVDEATKEIYTKRVAKNAIYNLKTDKKNKKMGNGGSLNRYEIKKLPLYIQNNINEFKNWID